MRHLHFLLLVAGLALAAAASACAPVDAAPRATSDETALADETVGELEQAAISTGIGTGTTPIPTLRCGPGGCWTSAEGFDLHADHAFRALSQNSQPAISAAQDGFGPVADFRTGQGPSRAVRVSAMIDALVGVDVDALHSGGATIGTMTRSRTATGMALELLHTGADATSRLLAAKNSPYAGAVFQIMASGDVHAKGVKVLEFGPKGPKGDDGANGGTGSNGATGPKGPKGATGDPGSSSAAGGAAVSVCRLGVTNCAGICPGGTVTASFISNSGQGCVVTPAGGCGITKGSNGACCVCDP